MLFVVVAAPPKADASPYCVHVVPKLSVALSLKEYFAPRLIEVFSQIGDKADVGLQSEAGSEKYDTEPDSLSLNFLPKPTVYDEPSPKLEMALCPKVG